MYKDILIPIALDHDANIRKAVQLARRVQDKGGRITLVAVFEDVPGYVAEYVTVKPASDMQAEFKDRLKEIAKQHGDCDIAVMTGKPGVAIPDLAEETKADLIIISSHRPGAEDYFLGSTASRVVRRAPCSVMVLR